MSHLMRFDADSDLCHVAAKGIEGRQNATNRCETLSSDTFAACYAWALLSNHVVTCSLGQTPSRQRRLRHRS